MSYAQRLLQSGSYRLLQNSAIRDLEGVSPDPVYLTQPGPVYVTYPKTTYGWTDRTGITTPDMTGTRLSTGLVITGIGTSGTLVVTADGAASDMTVGIAIVLWDERNNPISVISGTITLSGWLKNSSGYYIAANSLGSNPPGFLAVDVSLAAGYTVLVQSILPAGTVNLHWKLF